MRKYSFYILMISFLIIIFSCGPKKYVFRSLEWAKNKERLDTALKAINKATTLEETKNWPKTYYTKGMVLHSIYQSNKKAFKDLHENPLIYAFQNYKKAAELDKEGSLTNRINLKMVDLYSQVLKEAAKAFKGKDYETAYKYFVTAVDVKKMEVFDNNIDTANMFNAGLSALNSQNWKGAVKYLEKAYQYDYKSKRGYVYLEKSYLQLNDTAKAIEALEDGFNRYPGYRRNMADLINLCVKTNQNKRAMKYIQKAKDKFPEETSIYITEGSLYEQMDQFEKAEQTYKEALEIDPDNEKALYNLGVLYYNKGLQINNKATRAESDEKYKSLIAQADSLFEKSVPYFEKVLQKNPDDIKTMETLSRIYYRFQEMDKYKKLQKRIEQAREQKSSGKNE